jgi:hypothetical protein
MKGKATPFLIAGAAAAAYFLFRNAKNFGQTFRATISKVRFNKTETQRAAFLRAFFDVNIEINNPTGLNAKVQAVKLDVLLNKKIIGTVNQTSTIELTRQAKTILPVLVGINTLSLYGTISNAIKAFTSRQPLGFTVVGTILTNYGTINVSEYVNVP